MDRIAMSVNFYVKPFLYVTLLNIVIYITFGSYFEDYEGIFSSFVKGVYTSPVIHGTDVNVHFLIMKFYFFLNRYFETLQIYGVVLIVYNWICLTLAGLVLYRLFHVNLKNYSLPLFLLLYMFICADNMLNLSTTRIAFMGAIALIAYNESVRLEKNSFNSTNWLLTIILSVFLALLRPEAVFITGVIYILVLLVCKRWHSLSLPLFFSGVVIFGAYYFIMSEFETEPKRVYYTHEKDLVDRSNLSYDDTSVHSLDLRAFLEFGISDKDIFTESFYQKLKDNRLHGGLYSILNGLSVKSFFNTLSNSLFEIYKSRYFVLMYLFIGLLYLLLLKTRCAGHVLLYIAIAMLPFLVCLNTIAPARFLVPYYLFFTSYCFLGILQVNGSKRIYLNYLILLFLNICLFKNALSTSQAYRRSDYTFVQSMKRLGEVSSTVDKDIPVVICNLNLEKFIPVDPLSRIHNQKAVFLNLYLLNSYEFYINRWKDVCHCDALSVNEKMDYIIESKSYLIIDKKTAGFMIEYFERKFGHQISFTKHTAFDRDLDVCTVTLIDSTGN